MPWHYQLHTKHFNYYDKANLAAPSFSKRIKTIICQLSFLFFENTEHLSKCISLAALPLSFSNTSAYFFAHVQVISSHVGQNIPLHHRHRQEETTISNRL